MLSRGRMIWLHAHPLLPSQISNLDWRHAGRLRKRDNFLPGEGGRGCARSWITRPQESLVILLIRYHTLDNGNVFQTCVGEPERFQTAWRMILTSDANEYFCFVYVDKWGWSQRGQLRAQWSEEDGHGQVRTYTSFPFCPFYRIFALFWPLLQGWKGLAISCQTNQGYRLWTRKFLQLILFMDPFKGTVRLDQISPRVLPIVRPFLELGQTSQ